ncbi:MAG: PQQ-dependent sugar dehydrogenase [Planctomycetaceae bacterium]|nr:PQQ-dependent sugar dehydrogenase [Planctomycetaceae bacterium]
MTARRFPHLKFERPLLVRTDPQAKRLYVAEQSGRIYSFPDDDKTDKPNVFLNLRDEWPRLTPHSGAAGIQDVYGLAFHPKFPDVPFCWVTYTLRSKQPGNHLEDGTRLVRYRVTIDGEGIPRCDPTSEQLLLTWLQGGHNGACLEFGPDSCLYISAGDGEVPNPPDPRDAGQDISNLLSTIMRIQVSTEDGSGHPLYTIPPDNPFVDVAGARGEIWSYGFRNPWKMTFAPDGELWVGDVGWELYEMVYRVQRGGNFGWSIMEGPQPVRPDARRGPTEILPPAIALPHTDAASVTGGYVYRGHRFPELTGTYIFGDFETRRIWSAEFDGRKMVTLTDLVAPSLRLVAFAEDASGELLLLDYDDGTLHEFRRNPSRDANTEFPQSLTQTGIFDDTRSLTPADGVLPFEIQLPEWADGAQSSRLLAVPGTEPIQVLRNPVRRDNWMLRERMRFATDSVLAKTITLTDDSGRDIRLETQVLHFDGHDWKGYSYVWNPQQTDAILSPAEGTLIKLRDYGNFSDRQNWPVHSRGECQRCHNQWIGGLLAFTIPQLNTDKPAHQLQTLKELGWLTGDIPESESSHRLHRAQGRLLNQDRGLEPNSVPGVMKAARSYLDVNCAHCHQNGAGGTATIDLRQDIAVDRMGLIDSPPAQGTFGLRNPALIRPGQPASSVLLYRLAVTGRGHMPHIGSTRPDVEGIRLVRTWIESLENEPRHIEKHNPEEIRRAVELKDTSQAIQLLMAIEDGSVDLPQRDRILKVAREASPEIRGLFDHLQPAEFRIKVRHRISPDQILTLNGNPENGQMLFAHKRLQCKSCHQLHGDGGTVGPALDDVGKRLTRQKILESLLEPSRHIEPEFETWTSITKDGRAFTGIIVSRTNATLVLRDAKSEIHEIPQIEIEEMNRQAVSMMPERLLEELSDHEIASLLEFLVNQQSTPVARKP